MNATYENAMYDEANAQQNWIQYLDLTNNKASFNS